MVKILIRKRSSLLQLLANNESLPELSANLTNLMAWIKEQIRVTQDFLGHELKEGLYVEDDDDDF